VRVVRDAAPADDAAIVALSEPHVRAGETYALDRDLSAAGILAFWRNAEKTLFVCEDDGVIGGVGYIRANQGGGGAHVANAGFMTLPAVQGKGVARALCAHAIDLARQRGFRAMQFNFVVSTNARAVALWESFGFEIRARLPEAFLHPTLGYVDALIMYKRLV
jgi:ribosomal protein S18 acetylase RimI-like enzyme